MFLTCSRLACDKPGRDVKAALIELLCDPIEHDRFPRSPRLRPCKAILFEARRGHDAWPRAIPAAEATGSAEFGADKEAAAVSEPENFVHAARFSYGANRILTDVG